MNRIVGISGVFAFALLTLSAAPTATSAQPHDPQFRHRSTAALTLAGPAIRMLVAAQLPSTELRKLVTDPRTVRRHPDLAKYYRNKARRLELEAEKYARFARAAGDSAPVDKPNHDNVSRTARFDYLIARDELRQAQEANLLAALNAQAEHQEGCFNCHSLHGRGGKIAPDLAIEGARNRTDAWLIGHFKDPQAYTPHSAMPPFAGLTSRQLGVLSSFLQYQKAK